jgi:hypothetical protein
LIAKRDSDAVAPAARRDDLQLVGVHLPPLAHVEHDPAEPASATIHGDSWNTVSVAAGPAAKPAFRTSSQIT